MEIACIVIDVFCSCFDLPVKCCGMRYRSLVYYKNRLGEQRTTNNGYK